MNFLKIRAQDWSFYTLFCVFGLFTMFYPTLLSGFSKIQTDPGDTRLVNYFLEHSFQLIFNSDYIARPWSPAFFYPFRNVLAFSENMWGTAPLYWMFRTFGSADYAFQLWMILVAALNFFCFAFFLHQQSIRRELVTLGSFLFAFGMPRVFQLGHQQLLPQFFTPLAILFLWKFIRHPTHKYLAISLLFVYLQVLAGIYLGWFLLLSLLVAVPLFWGLHRFNHDDEIIVSYWRRVTTFCRDRWVTVILIVTAWGLGLILTLRPYLKIKSVIGDRTYAETDQLLPRIISWFLPSPHSIWGRAWYDTYAVKLPAFPGEHSLFLGFTIIALFALGLYVATTQKIPTERSLLTKLCFGIAILLFLLSIRLPNGFSFWKIIYFTIPGATAIRAVSRIWIVLYVFLLVAICLSVDSYFKSISYRRAGTFLSAILALCIAEQITLQLPAYEKTQYLDQEAEIAESIKGCDVAYLQVRPEHHIEDQLTAMWAGLKVNVPTVNGYSGKAPPNYYPVVKPMSSPQVINWLVQSQQSERGFREKQRLCLMNLSQRLNLSSFSAFGSFNLKVQQIQLPIVPLPNLDVQYLPSSVPKDLRPNDLFQIPVILRNTSNFVWSSWGAYPTHFSYVWFNASEKLSTEQIRTKLPSDVSPGESIGVNAAIRTPSTPGEYGLVLTMVRRRGFWFFERMSNPFSILVRINPA